MEVRLLEKEECDAVEELAVIVSGEKWRALARDYIGAMFSDVFRRPVFIVAVENGQIIGCAAISEELFTVDVWGISWVNVHPDCERRGIGQKLVEACLHEITARTGKEVTVILNTYPGKTRLYDKMNFKKIADDHEGGHFMIKYVGGNQSR